jgi:hypothetical protein
MLAPAAAPPSPGWPPGRRLVQPGPPTGPASRRRRGAGGRHIARHRAIEREGTVGSAEQGVVSHAWKFARPGTAHSAWVVGARAAGGHPSTSYPSDSLRGPGRSGEFLRIDTLAGLQAHRSPTRGSTRSKEGRRSAARGFGIRGGRAGYWGPRARGLRTLSTPQQRGASSAPPAAPGPWRMHGDMANGGVGCDAAIRSLDHPHRGSLDSPGLPARRRRAARGGARYVTVSHRVSPRFGTA